MKTTIIPQIRVEPKLRADVESVLNEGETLSEFVEATVRRAVEFRRMQMAFQARADAAWKRFQKSGKGRPAEEVVAELQSRLDAQRRELQDRRRPFSVQSPLSFLPGLSISTSVSPALSFTFDAVPMMADAN